MTCLRPQFDPSSFNFTQIKNDEHLFDVEYKGGQHRISFIINNSPLTRNHCLVVPDLDRGYPQILNTTAIEYALSLLADLDNRRFRIGYNSPGALASVNHLHLHLVDVPNVLFSEHFVSNHCVFDFIENISCRHLFCRTWNEFTRTGIALRTHIQVLPWSVLLTSIRLFLKLLSRLWRLLNTSAISRFHITYSSHLGRTRSSASASDQ